MLAVLSPAKSLKLDRVDAALPVTEPALMKDASSLMRTTRNLSQKRIRELMSLSQDLAKLNYDRYRSFELPFTPDNALPAALTFNGDVYRGLKARELRGAMPRQRPGIEDVQSLGGQQVLGRLVVGEHDHRRTPTHVPLRHTPKVLRRQVGDRSVPFARASFSSTSPTSASVALGGRKNR